MSTKDKNFTAFPLNDDDMVWRNPCPDASAPSIPSGKFGTFTLNTHGDLEWDVSPGLAIPTLTDSQTDYRNQPSLPGPLSYGKGLGQPGFYKEPLELAIDSIRKQFSVNQDLIAEKSQEISVLTELLSETVDKLNDANAKIDMVREALWMYDEAHIKLTKIKAIL